MSNPILEQLVAEYSHTADVLTALHERGIEDGITPEELHARLNPVLSYANGLQFAINLVMEAEQA